MPNWCYNQIAIILPEELDTPAERQVRWDILRDLKHHLDTAPEGEREPFSILHPVPPELDDNAAHTWRVCNWRTKWEMEVYDYEYKHNYVFMNGPTAWGPPWGVFRHLESLGFVVEIQFHSSENAEWGCACGSVNTDGVFDIYSGWIDVDDEEDYLANEILEFDEEKGRDITIEECIGYLMTEEFKGPDYNPEFRVLERQWMIEMFEDDADQMMESYEEWKENNPDKSLSDAKKEFQVLREWFLNKIERGNEEGKYNEGQYLELMNSLKDTNLNYLRELWEEHTKKFELSNFYSGDNREPKLVGIYA